MGAERAVAHLNAWLDRIHVSLNDDLVPYFMDGIKVSAYMLVGHDGSTCVCDCRGFVFLFKRRVTLSRSLLPSTQRTANTGHDPHAPLGRLDRRRQRVRQSVHP